MGRLYRLGRVTVDPEARKIAVGDDLVVAGSRAFDVLLVLIHGHGRVVRKQELLDAVWPGLVVEEANVQVQISTLRKILGHDTIATIPGFGYRLCVLPQAQGVEAETSASDLPRARNRSRPVPVGTPTSPPYSNADQLPAPMPRLVGRELDLQEVCSLLESHGTVSIVGPGGIGKTVLALAVAHTLASRQRVQWVELSSVAGSAELVPAIARSLGLSLGRSGASASSLAGALAGQALVLILDNCEHLVDGAASVAEAVTSVAPTVRILATSQQRLQVSDEQVYRLDPLAVPPLAARLDEARHYAGLLLLERRARALDRHFALDEGTLADVIELSRQLDGIPLAIEMAAARLPMFGVKALLNSLRECGPTLRNVSRGAPERQRTLQAMLAWSYALLDEIERAVLQRLSAFTGVFRLEAAVKVGGADASGERTVVDAIAGLVDKSLVQLQSTNPPRYRLLETTRSFAAAKLAETGEAESVRDAHATAMADLGILIEKAHWIDPMRRWQGEHLLDYADLQTAFDHAAARGDAAAAGAVGDALQLLDVVHNTSTATRRRIDLALALVPNSEPVARARLWNCVVTAWIAIGPRTVSRLEAAQARADSWKEVGDARQLYRALGMLAVERARQANPDGQVAVLDEMRGLEDAAWPPRLRWEGRWLLAHACEFAGDASGCAEARRLALGIATGAGDDGLVGVSRMGLAEAALLCDDMATVIELTTPLIDGYRSTADPVYLVWALERLNNALVLTGDVAAARGSATEMVGIHRQMDTLGLVFTTLALFAVASGHPETAAEMLGFADAWLKAESMLRPPVDVRILRIAIERIDASVGLVEQQRHRAIGASLSRTDAEALVVRAMS